MSEWISVKVALPEIKDRGQRNPSSENVLCTDGEHFGIAVRWTCGDKEYFLPDYREEFTHITHWMPLPQTPKDE